MPAAARRVLLPDARGDGRHLRVTWHAEAGRFTVTTWHDDVCAGSVQLEPGQVPALLALLADGLASTTTTGAAIATGAA